MSEGRREGARVSKERWECVGGGDVHPTKAEWNGKQFGNET